MNKKLITAILCCLTAAGCALGLTACSGNDGGESGDNGGGSEIVNPKPDDTKPDEGKEENVEKEITGVTFENKTVTYNGQQQKIEAGGTLPEGVSVAYEKNTGTDAGTYTAKATFSGTGYKTKTLTATLAINKAQWSGNAFWTGLTFENKTYDYDGKEHTVVVAGVLPEGVKTVYACEGNANIENGAVATGSYTITASFEHKNYIIEKTLTAKLVIRATDKDRYVAAHNGTLYFANALDKDKLYSYTSGTVTKISNDVPYGFAVIGNKFYFQSNSLLFSSIKSIDASHDVESVAGEKGEYLCTDGMYLYFVRNALTNANSGIYKINPAQEDPEAVLVSAGKAEHMQYVSGYLYFADGANGGKLSRVSVSGGERSVVVDEKITCLTASANSLYFTVNKLLGDYIARYDISSGNTAKLTQDAGANLTVVGTDLYYVNVDLLSSNLMGKGIYKVKANASSDSNAVGEKVIERDNSLYSSLTKLSDSQIAYYRVSDQMLIVYNVSTGNETEVLDGFEAPEYTPISRGSKTQWYGGKLYYLDIYNDKALYSYDPASGDFVRITSCKVSDFTIIGDNLYFNGVSYGVNNDLYKVSLTDGGLPEKISTYDCNDIVTDGTNIFYVEKNAAGARTAIHIIKPDGTDYTDKIIYTKGATNLTYYEGNIYFVDGKDLLKMPVTGYTVDETVKVKDGNVDTFVIDNGVVYFRELYGVGQKRLACINIDGTGYAKIMTSNTDPLKIAVKGDKIYYYTDTTLGTSGIYVIDKSAREDTTPTLLMDRANKYYAEDFTVGEDGKIYFVNYYNTLGDSHLYCINTTGTNQTPQKLA